MLAIIAPEKMKIIEGMIESNSDFTMPDFFHIIIQIKQYANSNRKLTIRYIVKP